MVGSLVAAYYFRQSEKTARTNLDRAVEAFPKEIGFLVVRRGRRKQVGDLDGATEDYIRLLALGYKAEGGP